jgi:hypothetical protein
MHIKKPLHPFSASLYCDPQELCWQLEQALVPELTPSAPRHSGES